MCLRTDPATATSMTMTEWPPRRCFRVGPVEEQPGGLAPPSAILLYRRTHKELRDTWRAHVNHDDELHPGRSIGDASANHVPKLVRRRQGFVATALMARPFRANNRGA